MNCQLGRWLAGFFGVLMSTGSLAMEFHNETLKIGYGTSGGEPYEILNDRGDLVSGINYDLGEKIAGELGKTPLFYQVPVLRADDMLVSGMVDVLCLYNPLFLASPGEHYWSDSFYKQTEVFIVPDQTQINSRDQLSGLSVGTHLGYNYHPETMKLFSDARVSRVDKEDSETLYKLLSLGRLGALIDTRVAFDYRMKKNTQQSQYRLKKSNLIDGEYDLSCVLSQKSLLPLDSLNLALRKLVDTGEIASVFNRYR
jgi:ABC-type amino acid transport substrate-binding protein